MSVVKRNWFLCLSAGVAVAASTLAWQAQPPDVATRLFVEPFITKSGTGKLQEEITRELRKLNSVSLVPDRATADLVLGGGGDVWVRGYRSFSPRSHMKLPSNGTPVYTGYLSVELRNAKGETLWSYLAVPGAGSEDVFKDLSKRITRQLAQALNQDLTSLQSGHRPQIRTALKGAGATFPFPVYAKWFTNYHRENPNLEITYDSIGSEAGVRRLLAGLVDFGASENPESIHALAPGEEGKYLLFPSVVGAVVPVVNLPGFPSDIAFTPEALAGIFLGKTKKWNDPILRQANRGLHLPDLDIVVVHRADGSGTTFAWTDFLSKTSPEWAAQVGSSLAPKWPTGRAADGNEGVAALVKEIGGSIGYVEFIYALQNHLSFGKVRNRNGEFVAASLESIAVSVSRSVQMRDDFKISIANPPGTGAYPISSFTWIVVPAQILDDSKRSALVGFLGWMLGPGQRQAAALGYLALPQDVIKKEEAAILRIH